MIVIRSRDLFVRTLAYILITAILAFLPYLTLEAASDKSALVAFSLDASQTALERGEDSSALRQAGHISRIWGVVVGPDDELIFVGERDSSVPNITLDDIAIALRTAEKIGTEENPGVTIEPLEEDGDGDRMAVRYFAGIDGTRYGKVSLEADLLLKLHSLGRIPLGVSGMPSEWDLRIDNERAGREVTPWEEPAGVSWFFPYRINLTEGQRAVVVSSIRMQVQSTKSTNPSRHLYFDLATGTEIQRFLEQTPAETTDLHSRLFTQEYKALSEEYPVLIQLENLLALSGLLDKVSRSYPELMLDYWKDTYEVEPVSTPTEITTMARTEMGLAYSVSLSGGVTSEFSGKDGWVDSVLALNPEYLRSAVLLSRPSPESISWKIPLELGHPDSWSESALREIRLAYAEFLENRETRDYPDIQEWIQRDVEFTDPDWRPPTLGNHMLSMGVNWLFNLGGNEFYSAERGASSAAVSELMTGAEFSIGWIYRNHFELSLAVPLEFRFKTQDQPGNLPGIGESVVGYALGVEDPELTNRILLWDGIIDGRWVAPLVIAEFRRSFPQGKKFSESIVEGEEYVDELEFEIEFGYEEPTTTQIVSISQPLTSGWRTGLVQGKFSADEPAVSDRRFSSLFLQWRIDRRSGTEMEISFSEIDEKPESGAWNELAQTFRLSWLAPTRHGTNRFGIGWYDPKDTSGSRGAFLLEVDLSGWESWSHRVWF